MKNNKDAASGIVLFAKQTGKTSFSSLYTIKRALSTKKVGHTGTLDSFAQGLLVVMAGSLTKLSQRVTSFDKKYEAIIAFGSETDTLDPFGEVIKKDTGLPTLEDLEKAVRSFEGDIMQTPPSYSAIHINGKRASDLARSGKSFEIPKRKVCIYSAKIVETCGDPVRYARIAFHVSKGTYIRCLARDIAYACNSSAHLVGLLRTAVGSFSLSDAAGVNYLDSFTIKDVLTSLEDERDGKKTDEESKAIEYALQKEVLGKIRKMTPVVANECGFLPITLKKEHEFYFFNGRPLYSALFLDANDTSSNVLKAVFCEDGFFAGVIEPSIHPTTSKNGYKYSFVVQRPKKI